MSEIRLENHYAGELAYYDSFLGLIKVKVIRIDTYVIVCKCTSKNRLAYKHGEMIVGNQNTVIPRKSVYVRDGQYRIRNNYKWR